MTTMGTKLELHCRNHHKRGDSGELDVFEATRYFHGEAAETYGYQPSLRKFAVHGSDVSDYYSSVDDYVNTRATCQPQPQKDDKKQRSEKKSKTPKSPGNRLASLLNSLFSAAAGKRTPKPTKVVAAKDYDENLCGRRRRSSISHLQSSSYRCSAKSLYYSSSVSGFEAPSSDSSIARFYKEFNDIKNDDKMKFYPKIRRSSLTLLPWTGEPEKKCIDDAFVAKSFIFSESFLDREGNNYNRCLWKEKCPNQDDSLISGYLRKGRDHDKENKSIGGKINQEKGGEDKNWSVLRPHEKESRKMEGADEEEGFMSDSSSDLFELQNYDIGRD